MKVIDFQSERNRRESGPIVRRELACYSCGFAWSGVSDLCGASLSDQEIDEAFALANCPKCGVAPVLVLWRESS